MGRSGSPNSPREYTQRPTVVAHTPAVQQPSFSNSLRRRDLEFDRKQEPKRARSARVDGTHTSFARSEALLIFAVNAQPSFHKCVILILLAYERHCSSLDSALAKVLDGSQICRQLHFFVGLNVGQIYIIQSNLLIYKYIWRCRESTANPSPNFPDCTEEYREIARFLCHLWTMLFRLLGRISILPFRSS
jgi:hypothetical protein